MANQIKWIDFRALERDDVDEEFGLFEFMFMGTRYINKHWWWIFIPFLNISLILGVVITWISIPIRLYVNASQLRKLRKNAYDIEDTSFDFRLIRNVRGDLGLCEWGKTYEFSRKILLTPQYVKVDRWNEYCFIVTDKNYKMGLYRAGNNEWILPCTCDKITIVSDDIVNATMQGRSQRYNIKGDRILN